MATPKHPDQYPAELAQAVNAALTNGELFIPQDSRGQALSMRRYLYTWAKAVRNHPMEAPAGLASQLNQVEFVIKTRDLGEGARPGVLIRSLKDNPMAQAIRSVLPTRLRPDEGPTMTSLGEVALSVGHDLNPEEEESVSRLMAALAHEASPFNKD